MENFTQELTAPSTFENPNAHKHYKTLAINEGLYNAILNSLTAQIAVLNKEGVIQTINESWKNFESENRVPGSPVPEIIGLNYLDLCSQRQSQFSDGAPLACKGIISVLNGTNNSFTIEYPHHTTEKQRWFLMSVTALPGVPGAVVSHIDITDRKAMEQMKDEFIDIASHELKTPITSLKGIVHILQLSYGKVFRGEGAKLLRTMDIQLNKLTKIIGDLLDVNTIPGKEIQLSKEKFDFKKLVQETLENVQNLSPLHFLTIKENMSISFSGDKFRLEQVITNLLTNAVKYSPQSNQVIINSIIKDNKILLSVQDFGIGVEKENLSLIFERFYRVNNGFRFGGLGLGLYISSQIIIAHKGKLWLESEAGKGSTFYFSLPLDV